MCIFWFMVQLKIEMLTIQHVFLHLIIPEPLNITTLGLLTGYWQ